MKLMKLKKSSKNELFDKGLLHTAFLDTSLCDWGIQLACVGLLHCMYFSKPLKRQTKIAADDILIFYFYLSKKIRLDVSSESSA